MWLAIVSVGGSQSPQIRHALGRGAFRQLGQIAIAQLGKTRIPRHGVKTRSLLTVQLARKVIFTAPVCCIVALHKVCGAVMLAYKFVRHAVAMTVNAPRVSVLNYGNVHFQNPFSVWLAIVSAELAKLHRYATR